jgi:tripartite ATP-independent transporter DctP family solute receptor
MKNMKRKGIFIGALMGVLILSLAVAAAPPAPKGEKVIIAGTVANKDQWVAKSLVIFKEYVEANTSIKVDIFDSGQLGGDKEVVEGIKYGTATMCVPTAAVMGNFVKQYNILSLPFLFKTQEMGDKILQGQFGKKLKASVENAGYKCLGIGDQGYRHTTNNVRPITKLEDYKGLKIRTMENPAHLDTYRALGANPTPMAVTELFSALQQGIVDGQENPLSVIVARKFNEVQKYLTLDAHFADYLVYVISKNFYDGLNAKEKKVLQEGVNKAVEYSQKAVKEDDAKALQTLRQSSMKVSEMAPGERVRIVQAVQPVLKKYRSQAGAALFDSLMKEIKKYK